MPEEEIFDLYSTVKADIAEFRRDMDIVEERLEDFKDRQTAVADETARAERGFEDLSVEGEMFKNVLGTLFAQLKQNSGALSALTDLFWGYIGAGIDTFLVKILIPAWEYLTGAEKEEADQLEVNIDAMDDYAGMLNVATDEHGNLEVSTKSADKEIKDFAKHLEDAEFWVDEYGNTIVDVGDKMYVFDDKTGTYIGSIDKLQAAFSGSGVTAELLKHLLADLELEGKVSVDEIVKYMTEGADAIRADFEGLPMLAEMRVSTIGEAAEEVRRKLIEMLVQLGIDPITGGPITQATYEAASMYHYGVVRLGVGGGGITGVGVEELIEYFLGGAT